MSVNPDCPYCRGKGTDPACEWDMMEDEDICEPLHQCPVCFGTPSGITVSIDEVLDMLGFTREQLESWPDEEE